MGLGGQRHAPAALLPGKTRYPLRRRLGGPQGRSARVRKISPPPGFNPRTVQPVASRYIDWAIPAPLTTKTLIISAIWRDARFTYTPPVWSRIHWIGGCVDYRSVFNVREKNILLEENIYPTRLVLNERVNWFLKLLLALNRPEAVTNNKDVQYNI